MEDAGVGDGVAFSQVFNDEKNLMLSDMGRTPVVESDKAGLECHFYPLACMHLS